MFNIWGTWKLFSKGMHDFTFPSAVYVDSNFQILANICYVAILVVVEWYLIAVDLGLGFYKSLKSQMF